MSFHLEFFLNNVKGNNLDQVEDSLHFAVYSINSEEQ